MNLTKQFFKYVSQNIFGLLGTSCYILADTYFISQAAGTDGTYAFFGMIDSSQDPSLVRLYKYSLADWSQVLVSEPIELAHCNDITYDSVNKRLVISRCTKTDGYLGLNFVDPETLQLTGSAETAFRQSRVAYLPESDGYVFGMEVSRP